MVDDLDDPFEPEFHRAASKARRKVLCYHGTSTAWFWSIVENGFSFDESRKAWEGTSPGVFVAFNERATEIYARRAVERFGGRPICFVLEVPMKELGIDIDDRETHDKGRNLQGMVNGPVPAKYITGVLQPVVETFDGKYEGETFVMWDESDEIPLKKFLRDVQRGSYRSIGIEPKKGSKPKVGAATAIDPEHVIPPYLVEVLNYTSLTDWLIHPKWGRLQRLVLARVLGGKLPNWRMMNASQWLAVVEEIVGEKDTEGYLEQVMQEQPMLRRPLYEVTSKFYPWYVNESRGLRKRR